MEDNLPKIKQKNKLANSILIFLYVIFFLILGSYFLFSSPSKFKDNTIHISYGESLEKVSIELKDKEIIRNSFILKVFVHLFKSNGGIVDGDYLIKKGSPVYTVAWQIARGNHKIEPVKVTLREGLTNEGMADILAQKLAGFRKDLFLSAVNSKQGYLFPDTYFFFPLTTTEEIIQELSSNFTNKIKLLKIENRANLNDIITMASILEYEAGNESDAPIISGILWKRIGLGMPLQVDAVPSTYKEKGLPSGPINNPGLLFIKASMNPVSSSYLYYLHDKNGVVHYAKTFAEHKININKYLK